MSTSNAGVYKIVSPLCLPTPGLPPGMSPVHLYCRIVIKEYSRPLSAQETVLISALHFMLQLPSPGVGLVQSAPCTQLQRRLLTMLGNQKRNENKLGLSCAKCW